MSLAAALDILNNGETLNQEQAAASMRDILSGTGNPDNIAHFLTLLAKRGETADEIIGSARVLREKAHMIKAPAGAVDCCGTGGDGLHSYNVSTAVALVSAACGVPMAKHGNRAASSKSGAADVLEALGVNLDIPNDALEDALHRFNFAFMMAPRHHSAMKHVVPIRKQLGFRTIFNLLGPLANPAGTRLQLIGVFDAKWMRPMADALYNLGTERAWIVHGHDGLDEITVTSGTSVLILDHGQIEEKIIGPEDFGLEIHTMDKLRGGSPQVNAYALRELLNGKHSAYRDITLINSAAVLVLNNPERTIPEAIELAADAIDSGAAKQTLENYVAYTQDVSNS